MAIKKPLIIEAGQVQQLDAADSVIGAGGGVRFQFDTDTGATDPGAGKFKFNFPPPGSLYISATDADGNDVSSWIEAWDDGNGVVTGKLFIQNERNGSLAIYNVFTGTVDNTGWYTVDISELETFSVSNGDYCRIWFQPQGNDGTDGVSEGLEYVFDSTTSSADPGSGEFRLNNATLSSVTALYISETDAYGANVSTIVQSWDDLKLRFKGWLKITKIGDAATWAMYRIMHDVTDNGTWDTYTLEYVSSSGAFTNGDGMMLSFRQNPERVYPIKWRFGLLWFRDGTDTVNDFAVYDGSCRSHDDTDNIDFDGPDPIIKRLDANWAVGTNQGGLDTGSRANNTWYWIWVIKRSDTGVVDILASTSNTTPTMPANYDKKRLIGAIRTGNAIIESFDTRQDNGQIHVRYLNPANLNLDVNVNNLSTSRVTYSLNFVPPFGDTWYQSVLFMANVNVSHASGAQNVYIASPDHTDSAPSTTAAPLASINAQTGGGLIVSLKYMYADRNAQITARSLAANTIFKVQVLGYFWPMHV